VSRLSVEAEYRAMAHIACRWCD